MIGFATDAEDVMRPLAPIHAQEKDGEVTDKEDQAEPLGARWCYVHFMFKSWCGCT